MINFFKQSKQTNSPALVEQVKVTQSQERPVSEIIQEIHETFYTEVDRLLADAHVSNSLETQHTELIKKAERLKKLGFGQTKEVIEAMAEVERINKLREENEHKLHLIRAINYFSQKYPTYKFITEESVRKICDKYGLVSGTVNDYIGTVPEKNIREMEQFKIDESDACWIRSTLHDFRAITERQIPFSEVPKVDIFSRYGHSVRYFTAPLEIDAPPSDFNMKGKQIVDGKVVSIPDPIVRKPVFYEGKKYYLIVTAWGLEASDELVVNERNN